MTTQPERPDQSEWMKHPPGAGEIQISIAIGEGAELTPELREAVDRMLGVLHSEEVAGYAAGTGLGALPPGCPDVYCHLGSCWPESSGPCYTNYQCKIKTPPKAGLP